MEYNLDNKQNQNAIAEKENAEAMYIGVVEEDSSGYPDCKYIKKTPKKKKEEE